MVEPARAMNEETVDSPSNSSSRQMPGGDSSPELVVQPRVNCVNDSGTICTVDTPDHSNHMANSLSQPLLGAESNDVNVLSDQLVKNINQFKLSGKIVKKAGPELVIGDLSM